ncbi:MAG: carboxylating nicotinate-nucleotide diphosphorylase [candidate division Zixibacteria bacterium]|nr:carboxylating nicotinate-nucleotide diphosphorylase [candidate division Zixibacteria bacterium]NIX59971.1 carboxylating nicotinate-nucleotide diphosphorylase [candidate division Zixibacteria bacterium]
MTAPTQEQIDGLVNLALEEDLGTGDITTDGILDQETTVTGTVTAKEPLVLCGLDIFRRVFSILDPQVSFPEIPFKDGDEVPSQGTIIHVRGKISALLKGERTALNILQRLSGIASLTRKYVETAHPVTILDTRKTTPGLRVFEKYAVRCGGGTNHRFGLFDAVLIKDNHIKIAGGITEAIRRIRRNCTGKIEVETVNLMQVREAIENKADIIMLDNMETDILKQAIQMIGDQARVEVSGMVKLENLEELKALGMNFLSIGALTHSARSVDISMNLDSG